MIIVLHTYRVWNGVTLAVRHEESSMYIREALNRNGEVFVLLRRLLSLFGEENDFMLIPQYLKITKWLVLTPSSNLKLVY